ncbi:MAG: universal stress protein [Gemmatimonadales bacterium]
MFRNVMVPVDGSSYSREAVLQGVRLASLYGATLRLVRVAKPYPLATGPDGTADKPSGLGDHHAAELADLYSIAAECRAHSTITVTASLEYGPIVAVLCGYARRHSVDLIVMRSHARSGIARLWFGSVADALIRESGVPVLVVRPPSVGTGIEKGFGYRKILVPLDGSVLAEQALPHAISLARFECATVELLIVVAPTRDMNDESLVSSIGPASERDVTGARLYLDSIVSKYSAGVRLLSRVIVSDDPAAAILDGAKATEADLIAMATRGQGTMARSIGGSVSDRVMRESTTTTLVIHPVLRKVERVEQVWTSQPAIA